MKIALIHNMNNNFFSLMRYLRDEGFDAELLLIDQEFTHFAPECDSFNEDYSKYIYQLDWGSVYRYYTTSKKKIKDDLKRFDFFICCGLIPAYLEKAGLRVDIFGSSAEFVG